MSSATGSRSSPLHRLRERRAFAPYRGHSCPRSVRLDRDLAALYGVETRVLNQAVKRNAERFPPDFMFALTRDEIRNISQFVISSPTSKHAPRMYAFTEQGVAMLSGVLNSPRAVRVNIGIMRAFVQLRRLLATHEDLARKLADLERKYDAQFQAVFDAIRQLMAPPVPSPKRIGFNVREPRAAYAATRSRPVRRKPGSASHSDPEP